MKVSEVLGHQDWEPIGEFLWVKKYFNKKRNVIERHKYIETKCCYCGILCLRKLNYKGNAFCDTECAHSFVQDNRQ